jgi:tRNA dimethylallyltransferase
MISSYPLITLLGPTAAGKTSLAAILAAELNAEIISADSRQVFRGMDIGTGKDLKDYQVDGVPVPFHLIDIADAGEEFSVFQFRSEFVSAWESIRSRGRQPLMCGGTGLYLDSILRSYALEPVSEDPVLRSELSSKSDEELIHLLQTLRPVHNSTDSLDRERLIRAVEIAMKTKDAGPSELPDFSKTPVLGLTFERKVLRDRITVRLHQRLREGMIDEVQSLLNCGISHERLCFYGLEYKVVSQYLSGQLDYEQMSGLLNTAIHQFAKRQMTWFRRMEGKGVKIFWLRGEDGIEENRAKALEYLKNFMI